MKIFREGKEFTLTPEELFQAYQEQKHLYDLMSIRDNMKERLDSPVFERLKKNKDFIESAAEAFRYNQDHLNMGYEAALSAAFKEVLEEFLLPVNRVTIIRECYSEHEIWADFFWVDASKTPSKELFQEAVEAFLMTKSGQKEVDHTCNDFNWGDAVMYVPDDIWNQFGIYSFDYGTPEEMGLAPTSSFNWTKIQVDQDEVLIPDDYLDRLEALKEQKPSLVAQIQSASVQTNLHESENLQLEQQTKPISTDKSSEVSCLCEEREGDDGIREFQILAISTEKDLLQKMMEQKIAEDEYGFIKENGVDTHDENHFMTNFNDGFVEYSITDQPVLSRAELEQMLTGSKKPSLSQQIQAAESKAKDVDQSQIRRLSNERI